MNKTKIEKPWLYRDEKIEIHKKFLIWETSGYNMNQAKLRVIGDVRWF